MEEEIDYEEEDFAHTDCPKCGRSYDEIGYDFQYCKACGWDAEKNTWDKPLKPTETDYQNGDADLLTGRWY